MLKDAFHRFETMVDMWLNHCRRNHLFQGLPLIFLEPSKILISTCSQNLFNRRSQRVVLLYLCFNPIWHYRFQLRRIIQEWKNFLCYYICHAISISRLKDKACFFKMTLKVQNVKDWVISPYWVISSKMTLKVQNVKDWVIAI